MNKYYKIILCIVLGLLTLGFAKDLVIKTVVEIGASQVLGAPVHIQGMSVGVFKQSVRIKGLRVSNPSSFPSGVLIDIAEAGVDYDLGQILKGKLHLPKVILNLKEMNVVKNKDGKLNVDALKVAEQGKPSKDSNQGKSMPMQIDLVILNLGKVTVTDYGKNPAHVQSYDIGVHDKTYKNIKSAQQLAALVMVEAMGPTALKGAAIYGAATFLGVAFLPLGAAALLFDHFSH